MADGDAVDEENDFDRILEDTEEIIGWRRLFGLALKDTFAHSIYDVKTEVNVKPPIKKLRMLQLDLSTPKASMVELDLTKLKRMFDVVITRKTSGKIPVDLPDGLDNLAEHNLLTYKSMYRSLTSFSVVELLGYYIDYRKQFKNGKNKLPPEAFRLYGVATKFPNRLARQVPFRPIQEGVFEIEFELLSFCMRIIVLDSVPKTPNNALWHLFSGVRESAEPLLSSYQCRTRYMNAVLYKVFEFYGWEGDMPYTVKNFGRDFVREHLHLLSPQEVLSQYKPEERLTGLQTEQCLASFTEEQIRAYLEQLQQTKH